MTELDRRTFIQASASAAAVALMPTAFARPPRAAEPVTIAVIGAGRQGRAVMSELQKLEAAKVIVVCDNDASRLRSGLGRAPGAEGVEDFKVAVTRPDVRAVIVETPTYLHRPVVEAALNAGKHVYCDAPLASTVDDARAIAKAASQAKTVFAAGFEGRSNPVYRLARTFFRSDSVRDLVAMRAQDLQKNAWRYPASDAERDRILNWKLDPSVSTGLMGELGSHQVDVAAWYTGTYPLSVRGSGAIRFWEDGRTMPDTVNAALTWGNGATLQYLASLACSFEGRHEVFYGSNATIKLAWSHGWMFKEADAPTQGWEVYANRQQFHRDEGITLIADATKLASQGKLQDGVGLPNPPLYYALEEFVRAIVEGTPVGCDAVEGMRSTIVGILGHQAVTSGKEIAIDPALLEAP